MAKMMDNVPFFKARGEIHIARKLFHVIGVVLILIGYLYLPRQIALLALIGVMLIIIPVDILRQKIPLLQKIVFYTFGRLMQKEEINSLSGFSWLLAGSFIIIVLFPVKVVTLSLLMLGIGDPICNIVGIQYGKDKLIGSKSLQGTLAGFVACSLISAVYLLFMEIMLDRLVLMSLVFGLVGAFTEIVPIANLDDNFTIPLVSACLLWSLFLFFGVH